MENIIVVYDKENRQMEFSTLIKVWDFGKWKWLKLNHYSRISNSITIVPPKYVSCSLILCHYYMYVVKEPCIELSYLASRCGSGFRFEIWILPYETSILKSTMIKKQWWECFFGTHLCLIGSYPSKLIYFYICFRLCIAIPLNFNESSLYS